MKKRKKINFSILTREMKIRLFFFVITVFNAMLIILFTLLPQLETYGRIPQIANVVVTIIFVYEYLWHIIKAKNKWRYIFSISGVVQLFSIFPITAIELQGVRLLKVIVGFSLYRDVFEGREDKTYENQFLAIIKNERGLLLWSLFSVVIIILSSAFLIFSLENNAQPDVFGTPFDSVWWAFQTVSTVGYGDVIPITAGGRVIAMMLSIVGIATFSIPTTLISTRFIQQSRDKKIREELREATRYKREHETIDALEKLYALKQKEAINQQEYQKLKSNLLK